MRTTAALVFLAACGQAEPTVATVAAPKPVCSLTHGTLVMSPDGVQARCDVIDNAIELSLKKLKDAGLDGDKAAAELVITLSPSDDPDCGGSIACTKSATSIIISSWTPPAGTYYDYGSSCYEILIGHELVHWALWVNGLDPDGHHTNPKYFLEPTSLDVVNEHAIEANACPAGSQTECKFWGDCD
jgi:hypothetical protein